MSVKVQVKIARTARSLRPTRKLKTALARFTAFGMTTVLCVAKSRKH
jgi:hypothetical protein